MSSIIDFSNPNNYHVAVTALVICIGIGLLLGFFIFKCKEGFGAAKDTTYSSSVGYPPIRNITKMLRKAPEGATMVFQYRVPYDDKFWDTPTRTQFLQSVDNYNNKVERLIKEIPSDKRIALSRDNNAPVAVIGINVLHDKNVEKDTCTFTPYRAGTNSVWVSAATATVTKPMDAIAFIENFGKRVDNIMANLGAVKSVLANYPPA